MNSSNVILVVVALVFVAIASVKTQVLKIDGNRLSILETDLARHVPGVLQKLLEQPMGNKSVLRVEQYDDPLPFEGGSKDFEIEDLNMSGFLSWTAGNVTGLSKLNYTDFEYKCGFAPGNTLFSWSGQLPSVMIQIPIFHFYLVYRTPQFNINLITFNGYSLNFGLGDVAVNLKAVGTCDDKQVAVSDLILDLGLQFVINHSLAELNGDFFSLTYLRYQLNTLFEQFWNNETQPKFENYFKCAVNIALEKCNSENIAICAQEPGINNPTCKKELEGLWKIPPASSSQGGFTFSMFNIVIVAFIALRNIK